LWIGWDHMMYLEQKDKPAHVSNMTLVEELGQVNYIFSDKTGTLTKNQMVVKAMAVGRMNFGQNLDGASDVAFDRTSYDQYMTGELTK